MSVQKDRQPFPINSTELDPAVTSVMGAPKSKETIYDQMARTKRMTPAQRKKAQKDKLRHRVMLDLPEDLDDVLEMLSNEEVISKSQLASFLIIKGLYEIEKSGTNNNWDKVPIRSLRFDYKLNLPALPAQIERRVKEFMKNKKS